MINLPDRVTIAGSNSFDILRYYLSFVVVFAHYADLTNTNFIWINNSGEAVRGFFILSGFLVFYSYASKPKIKDYTIKRIKRIFPAYFFIVISCTIGGIILTNFSYISYLSSPQLYKYLLSNLAFLNFIEPNLPGVFDNNIITVVNGSLWTMKVELLLYATVPLVYYFMKKYNKLKVIIVVFIFSFIYNEIFQYLYEHNNNNIYLILKRQVGGQLSYFYSGTIILLYFNDFQKYIKYIFPISLTLYILYKFLENPFLNFVEPFCFAAIIIGIAYNFKFFNFLQKYDNIAYGIYLFHFPVIQVIVNYRIHEYNHYLGLLLTIIITISLGILSWQFIEKPILNYKRRTK